ncbi:hypothetical protein LE181_08455 [Streptomyces sp. SCA3-4]|uniref:hypothetical protein n=1 Tax=Streptomyces sichuanensis TaxID=2871810 RepID=UPI001CE28D56|nr:hypothetical protein [Streptomyces sichuanensis]MCA6092190.1 hypothetical protein [Streptomyces sichuanensis]
MSLAGLQQLLTRSVRDGDFRRSVLRPDGLERAAAELGLTEAEKAQFASIDPDYLEGVATLVIKQRIVRREAEFGLFLNALFRYTPRGKFFEAYHQAVSVGQFGRMEELRRFVDFSFDYVVERSLPEYLVDLLRFCSHVCELAETPKAFPDEPEGAVRASSTLVLRKPYAVVQFRYDMLRLAKEDEEYGADPQPRPTTLLLQRDWRQPKRSRAFDLSDHPLLAALTRGPLTVLDAGGVLPHFTHGFVKELVESLHDRQIVHLMLPPELAAYGGADPVGTTEET